MKGLQYLVAGSLALTSAAGCSEYKGAGEYSCELDDRYLTARNGDKFAEFYEYDLQPKRLVYQNLTGEEALTAIKVCQEAFEKK